MKVVFMGTPRFAVPTLRHLADSQHEILAVVTNPDRPSGRGRRPASPPVKEEALRLGLPVLQPASLLEEATVASLAAFEADLFVVVAFSILPEPILSLPGYGSVNLHPSLLPAYRGAAPIIWAVIEGDSETGVTTFLLSKTIDAGDILMQKRVPIDADETAGELEDRLQELGAKLVMDTVDGLESDSLKPVPQGTAPSSRAPKVSREDGRVVWSRPAAQLRNLIRGTNPIPGAFTEWSGGTLKLHRSRLADPASFGEPGTVLAADDRTGLIVATGAGSLELTEVQPAGKSHMAADAFLRGHDVPVGSRFGASMR